MKSSYRSQEITLHRWQMEGQPPIIHPSTHPPMSLTRRIISKSNSSPSPNTSTLLHPCNGGFPPPSPPLLLSPFTIHIHPSPPLHPPYSTFIAPPPSTHPRLLQNIHPSLNFPGNIFASSPFFFYKYFLFYYIPKLYEAHRPLQKVPRSSSVSSFPSLYGLLSILAIRRSMRVSVLNFRKEKHSEAGNKRANVDVTVNASWLAVD